MFKPGDTHRVMRQFGIKADKNLGQNFLIEQAALNQILAAAELTSEDTVLEIGSGLGVLTSALAVNVQDVIAVELDRRLLPALEWNTREFNNVRIVHDDILALDLGELLGKQPYKVVANIPYNITSLLIRKLMEASTRADLVVLTIQREVAERIVAQPGAMNILALSVQVYGDAEITARIPAGCFFPRPGVDSAVIRVRTYVEPLLAGDSVEAFFRLVRAGFSQKRKQLKNALGSGLGFPDQDLLPLLESAGIRPSCRAQELSLEEWITLTRSVTGAE